MLRVLGLLVASSVVFSTSVLANERPSTLNLRSSGDTYYNKPGTDLANHSVDLAKCTQLARIPAQRTLNDFVKAQVWFANIENCMVVHGWRVIRVPAAEAASLKALPKEERVSRLASWLGVDPPHGEIAREWANEAWKNGGLSINMLAGLDGDTLAKWLFEGMGRYPIFTEEKPETRPFKAVVPAPTSPELLDAAPAGTAILIATVFGDSVENRVRIVREGPDFGTPAWRDGQPDTAIYGPSREVVKALKRDGAFHMTVAFVVPPGRWKIGGFGSVLDFCHGAPITEVEAGDVIFLGSFDLKGNALAPDMSLEGASKLLEFAPVARQRLTAAEWKNGATELCDSGFSYALEFPGVERVAARSPALKN